LVNFEGTLKKKKTTDFEREFILQEKSWRDKNNEQDK
jgi:hypothetical protein